MEKIKIILISVLALCAIVTVVMFSIEGIDYAFHYKTYQAVDKYLGEIKTASNKCFDNYNSIFSNGEKNSNKREFPSPIVFSPEMYNKAVVSCTQFKKDLAVIQVPENIPADKQAMLKKYMAANLKVADYFLYDLNSINKCHGETVCVLTGQKIFYKKNPDNQKIRLEGVIASLEVQKRPSFKYLFKLYPMENGLKQALKRESTGNK